MRLIDISNQRFGRLIVVEKLATPRKWLCICDCGVETHVTGPNLRNGSVASCGCLLREWSRKLGADPDFIVKRSLKITRHGEKKRSGASEEYKTWLRIKSRCERTTDKDYLRWGARGIKVCSRWQEYENFILDMGRRPPGKTSIDRINPCLGYEPSNCRWASAKEQGETKTNNIACTFLGVKYTSLKDAAIAVGVNYRTVYTRVRKGWTVDRSLSTPTAAKSSKSGM
jgi:hypothetical protein